MATVRVQTTTAHHAYRMQLAPGRYVINSYSGGVAVTVRPGITSTGVDLPQPGCL